MYSDCMIGENMGNYRIIMYFISIFKNVRTKKFKINPIVLSHGRSGAFSTGIVK